MTEYRTREPNGESHVLCLVDVPPPDLNQRVTVTIHGDPPTVVEFVVVGLKIERHIAHDIEYLGQRAVVELRQLTPVRR